MLASMNFVTPGPDGDVRFLLDNGWTGTRQRPVDIDLVDARPNAGDFRLDREGFIIDRIVSGVTDYHDPEQLTAKWNSAVKETVLRATGGAWAVLFAGPNTRFSERSPKAFSSAVSAPARATHNDLHGSFAFDQLAQQPFAEEAVREVTQRLGSRVPRRWRVYNVWQMISAPPQDTSLALCAMNSVAAEDIVPGKGFFADPANATQLEELANKPHQFDITFFRENSAHKWYYFSDMLPGETLIFSCFDPEDRRHFARVPHGAVDIPGASPNAVPRNSIETRALVVFDE